ncbi:MAG: recombinase family protein [Candidatus Nealsonbacteria bacterium]|nr:recombinase family protein [Candidatus Nealsonbacteria bacterium]
MAKTSTIIYSPPAGIQPITTKTKKAAIYIRCSSDEAGKEGYSPQTQEEKAKDFIRLNDYHLDKKHIYVDIGYSGGVDKRPGLQKLLTDAKNREFDVITVYRMDRFFRNLRLLLNTVAELREIGIEFKSVTEPFDTSTPTGRAMFANAGVFAEWMREVGLESRNEGMIKAMKEGKYLSGTARYGYDINEKNQKLKRNEQELSIVKMLFSWLVEEKLSEYKIQQRINRMKVPTKYDDLGRKKKTGSKCWWNRKTIGRIIRNDFYATGIYYYRKYKNPTKTKNEKNLRPKEEWIKVEDRDLKIIPEKLFEKAQLQLQKNKELSPRNTKQVYILQHKIICGFDGYHYQCARRVYHSKKRGSSETKYYFCTGNRSYFTPKKCIVPTISESRIVPPVWDKLKEILTNPDIIMQELKDYINQKGRKNKIEGQLKNIKNAIDSLNIEKERYAELYAESSITKEFYDKKVRECETEIETFKKEEEKLSQLLLTEGEKEKRIGSVKKLYSQLKESLENATYETKREILQRLTEKIIKTGERLDIEFNLPFENSSLQLATVGCSDNRRMD